MRKSSYGMLGKKHSIVTKRKIGKANRISLRGRKLSDETKAKMRIIAIKNKNRPPVRRGEDSHFWKGGITPINEKIRKSVEYALWRKAIFERDKYACIFCGKKGGELHADHIKPFAFFPELRFAIDNGRTLCRECHKKTPTYGSRVFKQFYGKEF